jgi:excisionase family DNA binding protein
MINLIQHEGVSLLALSVEEACEFSSIGRTTFYELMKSNQIPARKCGRRTIILLDGLHHALKSLPLANHRRIARPKQDE